MSNKVNPYTPGAAKRPTAFVGRARQFALIDSLADQLEAGYPAEDYVFTGLRGMGKTVLLKEALDRLGERGWLAAYYEIRRHDDPGTAFAQMLADITERSEPGGWFFRIIDRVGRRLGSVSLRVDAGSGTPGVELTVAPAAKTGDLFRDARSLLSGIGEAAAEHGTGVALLIDEMQQLRKRDLTLLLAVSREIEGLPVAIIGAGLPTLPATVAGAGSYAERFSFEAVDRLNSVEAKEALVIPAERFGVTYEPGALERVLALAEGYPYFLQLYGAETWRAAGMPSDEPGTVITRRHVEAAEPQVAARVDQGLYASRYERAAPQERQYLQAMARLGDADVASGEIARLLDKSITSAAPIRDRLLKKGLIHSPRTGRLDFSVPGFGGYVRRRSELDEDTM